MPKVSAGESKDSPYALGGWNRCAVVRITHLCSGVVCTASEASMEKSVTVQVYPQSLSAAVVLMLEEWQT